MKAIHVPETNTNLVLPGHEGERDLPATKIRSYDPGIGETEADAKPGIETVWAPDPDESIRLNCGAPIIVRIAGERHPPISVAVADIDEREHPQLWLAYDHSIRALGHLCGALRDHFIEEGALPEPPEYLPLWEAAIKETAQAPEAQVQEKLDGGQGIAAEPDPEPAEREDGTDA